MKNLYFLFIILFIHTNSQIRKINPKYLIERKYPFVLSTIDEYYYVITKGKCLKIQKESGYIIDTKDKDVFTSSDYVYFTDNSNNNYLYFNHKYYNITYNPFISFKQILVNSKPSGAPGMKRIGGIAQNNYFLVYGYSNDNNKYLLFSNIHQNNRNYIDNFIINDNLSCKYIAGENFICVMIINSNLQIIFLKYHEDSSNYDLKLISDTNSFIYNSFSSLGMYDTDKNNIKLLCGKKIEKIICVFLNISLAPINLESIGNNYLNFTSSNTFSERNCYLSQFNSEYLFVFILNKLLILSQSSLGLFSFKLFNMT